MGKVLVCGGAGYIGSHMVKMLHQNGYEVVTFDNLSTGHRHAVKWGQFVQGDLLNPDDLEALFRVHVFDSVMHFSARSLVAESMENPALYYRNNVTGTLNLLEQMRTSSVKQLVFSSTAATYGNPIRDRIDETHPQVPINPYGQSKLMVEQALRDYSRAYGIDSVSLRYFNAAGCDRDGELGEEHNPETHLIPNILRAAAGEKGYALKIFGDDYATPDGTCIRDYIHVEDLCHAHIKALEYLSHNRGAHAFNLGNGNGFSILQILESAQSIVGREIPYNVDSRRPGDPAILVADSCRAMKALQWRPEHISIDTIVKTAWKWFQKQ
jgi:UDP-glucose 4-epimerase